jgi:hypothetical protein
MMICFLELVPMMSLIFSLAEPKRLETPPKLQDANPTIAFFSNPQPQLRDEAEILNS